MKKHLLLFAMMLLPLVASAEKVEIDGIYYNLITKGNIAEVISNPNKYKGNVAIPETVAYQDVSYSVISIGEAAFALCTSLVDVIIPNSVTSIGKSAFAGSGLMNVTIGNSVTSIGKSAFYNCSRLMYVTIPNSVTSIGDGAFCCTGLKYVTIGNSVTSIGDNAFSGCLSLVSIIIPNSVKSIGESAFSGCRSLHSVTIPNSVKSIGERSFYLCSSLTKIIIPNSVKSIGKSAFRECSALTSITIPDSVTRIEYYTFQECSALTSVTIPDTVTYIGDNAFYKCSALTSITIPNSVTSINNYAFYGCSSLTSIVIGNKINFIGNSAFESCPNLADVICNASVPITNSDAFKDSYIEYATLHVPASAVNAYKAAAPWKNFKSIVALDEITDVNSNLNCTVEWGPWSSSTKAPEGSYYTRGVDVTINNYSEKDIKLLKIDAYINSSINDTFTEVENVSIQAGSQKTFSISVIDNSAMPSTLPWLKIHYRIGFNSFVKDSRVPGTTEVREINKEAEVVGIYDLNGVRLSEPKKGINIINGKKVVIK